MRAVLCGDLLSEQHATHAGSQLLNCVIQNSSSLDFDHQHFVSHARVTSPLQVMKVTSLSAQHETQSVSSMSGTP